MKLAAKVKAINLANEYANLAIARIKEFCQESVNFYFIQKNVFVSKLPIDLPNLQTEDVKVDINYDRSVLDPSLNIVVFARVRANHIWLSHTKYHKLAHYSKGILTTYMDDPPFRTDYTVQEAILKNTAFQNAKIQMRLLEEIMFPFKEIDFWDDANIPLNLND